MYKLTQYYVILEINRKIDVVKNVHVDHEVVVAVKSILENLTIVEAKNDHVDRIAEVKGII